MDGPFKALETWRSSEPCDGRELVGKSSRAAHGGADRGATGELRRRAGGASEELLGELDLAGS